MSDHQFLFLMLLLSDVNISIYDKIKNVKTNFDFIYQNCGKVGGKLPLSPLKNRGSRPCFWTVSRSVILGFKKSQKKLRGCCIFYLISGVDMGGKPLRHLLHIIYGGDIP